MSLSLSYNLKPRNLRQIVCTIVLDICTHKMNTISTVSALPRTPTNVNGMSSIVYIRAKNTRSKSPLEKLYKPEKLSIQYNKEEQDDRKEVVGK